MELLEAMRERFRVVVMAYVAVVERLTGELWSAFCDRHGDKRRDLVLWVVRRCTGHTLAELGRKAGGMDYAAVTMAVRRFPLSCRRDKNLARLSKEVLETVTMQYVTM
jgi:hypothetical protein